MRKYQGLQRVYDDSFRRKVGRFASRHGKYRAADEFKVSTFAAAKWRDAFGYPSRRAGAPKGNTNARGGRIMFR